MQSHAVALETVPTLAHDLCQRRVKGICEHDVSDHAAFEEGEGADAFCAVDDLVRHDKVARLDVLAQTADGGEGNNCAHAERAEGGNVGA